MRVGGWVGQRHSLSQLWAWAWVLHHMWTFTYWSVIYCASVQRSSVGISSSAKHVGVDERTWSVDVVQHTAQEQDHSDPHRRHSSSWEICQRCRPHHTVEVSQWTLSFFCTVKLHLILFLLHKISSLCVAMMAVVICGIQAPEIVGGQGRRGPHVWEMIWQYATWMVSTR